VWVVHASVSDLASCGSLLKWSQVSLTHSTYLVAQWLYQLLEYADVIQWVSFWFLDFGTLQLVPSRFPKEQTGLRQMSAAQVQIPMSGCWTWRARSLTPRIWWLAQCFTMGAVQLFYLFNDFEHVLGLWFHDLTNPVNCCIGDSAFTCSTLSMSEKIPEPLFDVEKKTMLVNTVTLWPIYLPCHVHKRPVYHHAMCTRDQCVTMTCHFLNNSTCMACCSAAFVVVVHAVPSHSACRQRLTKARWPNGGVTHLSAQWASTYSADGSYVASKDLTQPTGWGHVWMVHAFALSLYWWQLTVGIYFFLLFLLTCVMDSCHLWTLKVFGYNGKQLVISSLSGVFV